MYAIIGAWKMCYEGVKDAFQLLGRGESAGEAVAHAVTAVEDDPCFVSVGYGGLPARDGDTPIIGSGFYCDARYGGASATGLGEDIMRGCLSYDTVSLMRRGVSPQEACGEALHRLLARMGELGEADGGMSVIALDPSGRFGASTTIELFPFAAAREGNHFAMNLPDGKGGSQYGMMAKYQIITPAK